MNSANRISKRPVWAKALKASVDPARATQGLESLAETTAAPQLANASPEEARILCALFSGSLALGNWLVANPDALGVLKPDLLKFPRRMEGLRGEVDAWLAPLMQSNDYEEAFARLRHFKQREMLRIAARDLARLATVEIITRELSDVADVCLESVLQLCRQQLVARMGHPRHQDADGRWRATQFCVLGLGKLGGWELNYSSDVDVMFIYSAEGRVAKEPRGAPSAGAVANHQFFNRLAEMFVAEVGRLTEAGTLYRIDLRLRPEGDAGPLARSLASCENYYVQSGQTWERMMLIKARCVAGDHALAGEFLETIHSFRHPRSLAENVMREVAAMKDRIENELVKAGELDRNVKLGRGGIREIEFIVQTLQLIHAGRMPFLQGAQTLPALQKLVEYDLLPRDDAEALAAAYRFLRDVEHRLQMEDDQQTHTIPESRHARERLAALMGFESVAAFETARKGHTRDVRRVYDRLLKAETGPTNKLPAQFDGAEDQWREILTAHSFRDVEHALKLLKLFAHGPGYVHVSNRTTEIARQLLEKFLALCPPSEGAPRRNIEPDRVLSDPDRVLARVDSFVGVYGARATLYDIWNNQPSLFELLLLLFDRSEFLAEVAIHEPELVDELVTSERLRQRKQAAEILRDLQHGAKDADQRLWIRRYHQAELMRIALREILGLADVENNLAEHSALAEACLQYALEIVLRKKKIKNSPLSIIGLGKLGGSEISYGSDLDLIFVTGAKTRELPKLQHLAVEVMDLLSSRTELGIAFLTDARLRPDGEKGLLVNSLDAFESYYRHRAQLWEIQSLSRARAVAGDAELGRSFEQLVAKLTDFSPKNVSSNFGLAAKSPSGLAAYTPDWKEQIKRMRQRIEKERTPAGQDALAIKTGAGGLMDAEFLAQTFCLEHGWHEPNTLRGLVRARDEKRLPRADADALIENYRQLRRVEVILRRWSFDGEVTLPDDEPAFYRVSVRCGFRGPSEFRAALVKYRLTIRAVYNKVFCA